MVRIGGRSKGCATCLKRKIRCDEKIPECSQCLNGGRSCPGAVSGMVFLPGVAKQPKTTERRRVRRAALQKEINLPLSAPDSLGCFERRLVELANDESTFETSGEIRTDSSSTSLGACDSNGDQQTATQIKESCYKLSLQIPHQQLLTQQALSHFIDFFAKSPPAKTGLRSWMYLLPEMLSSAPFSAVKIPIIAASIIYIGSISNDKAIVMEGYKWYGSSLEQQRRHLQISRHRNAPPTVEEICMPLLLSFFEIICSTSPTAYFQHIVGAARLLEIRGPKACKSGIFHQLFLTVRVQMIYPSISRGEASIFANEEWLTIPFSSRPKTVFDRIVDILLCLPLLTPHLENGFFSKNALPGSLAESPLGVELKRLKDDLDMLWDDLRMKASSHGWEGDSFQGEAGFDFDHSILTLGGGNETRDAFTSSVIAFYSTARILVLSLLSHDESTSSLYTEQITAHCASILHAAEFLNAHDIGCAYIRLLLPLKVVGLLSSHKTHRESARKFLDGWRLRSGMRGICGVVLLEMDEESKGTVMQHQSETGKEQIFDC